MSITSRYQYRIECDRCPNVIPKFYDSAAEAEDDADLGWTVTDGGYVLCHECNNYLTENPHESHRSL